jgi:prepilin-type processing-associated H-X9-DG protein
VHYFFPKRMKRAFTLVQFVIVLGILMILAAIVFPIFGRVRDREHHPSCQSNLKQIMLGIKQYTQDYNEKFPMYQYGSNPGNGWSASIQPYLKSTQIYQCFEEPTAGNPDPGNPGYCDYFYNSSIGPRKGGRSEADLEYTAATLIIGDSAPFSSGNATNGGTITAPGIEGAKAGLAVAQGQWDPAVSGVRHLNGANYGFADGHVKWLLPVKVTRNPVSTNEPTFRLTEKNPPRSGS